MVRAGWRMLITHRQMLQWDSSGDMDGQGRTDLTTSWRTMWFAPLFSAAALSYLIVSRPAALGMAGPILGLWFASPVIAWWISQPLPRRRERLTTDQTLFLHKLSRKTWTYFETFVGPEDHWLPPDNFQEHPTPVIAHRTSPTNMGLALLANLSAYDFGYVSAAQLLERTTKALGTMQTLERHRGHFFNWYDTQSLKPLPPRYISSVDSGNLAGYLMTMQPGLLALADHKILGPRVFEGLSDTLGNIMDGHGRHAKRYAPARLAQLQQDLASATRSQPHHAICFAAVPRSAGHLRRTTGGQPRSGRYQPREPLAVVVPQLHRAMPGGARRTDIADSVDGAFIVSKPPRKRSRSRSDPDA